MALTKEEKELLTSIREKQIVTNTVLLGANGKKGLVDVVQDLASGHGKLKRNFWLLVGILAGSGVVGSGIYGLMGGG